MSKVSTLEEPQCGSSNSSCFCNPSKSPFKLCSSSSRSENRDEETYDKWNFFSKKMVDESVHGPLYKQGLTFWCSHNFCQYRGHNYCTINLNDIATVMMEVDADIGVKSLTELLSKLPHLRALHLTYAGMTDSTILIPVLQKLMPQLVTLELSDCHLLTESSYYVIVDKARCLQYLKLKGSVLFTEIALRRIEIGLHFLRRVDICGRFDFNPDKFRRASSWKLTKYVEPFELVELGDCTLKPKPESDTDSD